MGETLTGQFTRQLPLDKIIVIEYNYFVNKKRINDMSNLGKVNEALKTLEQEGAKTFVDTYKPNKWESIGMAISHANDFSFDMLNMIYTIAEDWNYHAFNEVLDFVFRPQKHKLLEECFRERLENALNKTVEVSYLDENKNWQTKKLKVKVVIEEI